MPTQESLIYYRSRGDRLGAVRFAVARPDKVFPGPERYADQAVARVERDVDPISLHIPLLREYVGRVDGGEFHSECHGCDSPAALVVFQGRWRRLTSSKSLVFRIKVLALRLTMPTSHVVR